MKALLHRCFKRSIHNEGGTPFGAAKRAAPAIGRVLRIHMLGGLALIFGGLMVLTNTHVPAAFGESQHQLSGSGSAPSFLQDEKTWRRCEICRENDQEISMIELAIKEVSNEIENYLEWIHDLKKELRECRRTKPRYSCTNIKHDIEDLEDRLMFLLGRLSDLEKRLESAINVKNLHCGRWGCPWD